MRFNNSNYQFLCSGPFHWTHVLLRCQGKLLQGCGPDDALIESAVFGPGVKDLVLNGSHYIWAPTGMLIVDEPDPFTLMADDLVPKEHNSIPRDGASGDATDYTGCKAKLSTTVWSHNWIAWEVASGLSRVWGVRGQIWALPILWSLAVAGHYQ